MKYDVINDLNAAEVNAQYPIEDEHCLAQYAEEIRKILDGRDKRMALIIGPCSAWSPSAVKEYADRLARLQEEVADELMLIMRMYVQKPRTTLGWEGTLNSPDPTKPPNLREGYRVAREMMYHVGMKLPMADEMLFTHNAKDWDNLLTYIAVGARSTEGHEPRRIASGMESVVGVKNTTSGSIKKGVDGVGVAQRGHDLLLHQQHIRTYGNPYAHLILRGGDGNSNFGPKAMAQASRLLLNWETPIKHPAIIVDASHENSLNGDGKDPCLQPDVVETVLRYRQREREGYGLVKGFMVESFLEGGKQNPTEAKSMDELKYGVSLTDACLPWKESYAMVHDTAAAVRKMM